MSERRVERVTVLLHRGGTIAIPWESQQALVAEMRPDSMRATRKAFKDCGTAVSVNLTPEQMGDVITVIEFMAKDAARGDDDPCCRSVRATERTAGGRRTPQALRLPGR